MAWAKPSQSQRSLMALAWPEDFESQSRPKPGQSHGFQAKPGRNNTKRNTGEVQGMGNLTNIPTANGQIRTDHSIHF
jgi:hypothetical protein